MLLNNRALTRKESTPDSQSPTGKEVGKKILITGAGKGIGRCCSKLASACGAHVIAMARTESDLHSLAAECRKPIEIWVGDVNDPDMIERISNINGLDGLINNAGTNKVGEMASQTAENIDTVINLNIKAAYRVAQAATQAMLKNGGGSIVHMSSQMGWVGSPGRTLYCMSKHAIEGLTKAMAIELAEHQIRVNSVAPTFVKTPMTEPMLADPEFQHFVMNRIPLRQLAEPEDIAHACIYLLSDAARMVTGSCLKVDGGWTAQ